MSLKYEPSSEHGSITRNSRSAPQLPESCRGAGGCCTGSSGLLKPGIRRSRKQHSHIAAPLLGCSLLQRGKPPLPLTHLPALPSSWHPSILQSIHPGIELRANLKSISNRCHIFEVVFAWELTKETIHLPLGCLQGGARPDPPPPPPPRCWESCKKKC